CIAAGFYSFRILRLNEPRLLQQALVLALPLLVMIIVFLTLTTIKPAVGLNIGMHLALLFTTAMICHGEMAHDRPAAAQLTEFDLGMGVGGVLGGVFNALVAPVAFNSLAEYPLAMIAACLLLPPLLRPAAGKEGKGGLAVLGVFLLVGAVLIGLRLTDKDP